MKCTQKYTMPLLAKRSAGMAECMNKALYVLHNTLVLYFIKGRGNNKRKGKKIQWVK
ncbi:MAG: hypothetical protein MUF15_19080 [Acidobacteria bacterium]|nr:hypothetical protein [Acidobacteriota bacterium]